MSYKANPKQRIIVASYRRNGSTGAFVCTCTDVNGAPLETRVVNMYHLILHMNLDKDGFVPQVHEEWDSSINDFVEHHYGIPFYDWMHAAKGEDLEYVLQTIINNREGRTEGLACRNITLSHKTASAI